MFSVFCAYVHGVTYRPPNAPSLLLSAVDYAPARLFIETPNCAPSVYQNSHSISPPPGVNQLAVAINKLDTVEWSRPRFDEIRGRLGTFLRSVGFREADLRYVPCSGLTGENLTQPAQEAGLREWYTGPTLLQVIGQWDSGW